MNDDEAFARLRPLMKTAGITRVANITGLDNVGIPVVLVVRPTSRSLSVSQGKGVTLLAAKFSGIMESLEQYFAERIELPLTLATRAERGRTRQVADIERLPRTVRPFTEDTRILWVTALDQRTGQCVEVPFELVHLDFTVPLPTGSGYFILGSNGLASGANRTGALAHAVWELIERDAMALFYERSPGEQARRRVALAGVDDPCCRNLIRRLEAAGLAVALWDMTTDVGVAAFLCSVGEASFDPLHHVGLARGYGCHPDRAQALRRALTEAAQSRLTRIAGSRDDLQAHELDAIRSVEAFERHHAHVAQEELAPVRLEDGPSFVHESEAAALEWTLERLAAAGFDQVLSVDLGPSEGPIAVVRAIIPGLESIPDAAGYAPGLRVRALRAAS